MSDENVVQQTVSAPEQVLAEKNQPGKTFTQEEVNEMAYKWRQENREQRQAAASAQSQPQMDETKFRQMMREEAARVNAEQIQQNAVKHMVGDLMNRISGAKDKYADFDEKVGQLPLAKMPGLVPLLLSVDNTDDVLYELSKYPSKAHTLFSQQREGFDDMALAEVKRLSRSIKDNQKATQNIETPAEPLGQIKPSQISGDDGKKTMADFKKMFRR